MPSASVVVRSRTFAVLIFAVVLAGCSNADPAPAPASGGVASKSIDVDQIVAGAGVTTLVTLTFTAPRAGTALVSASGNCFVADSLPVTSELGVDIETDPTSGDPQSAEALFVLQASGDNASFSTQRDLAVSAGRQSVYLNVDNPSTGGKLYCSASMTLVFSDATL
jgi:hypothetical protein